MLESYTTNSSEYTRAVIYTISRGNWGEVSTVNIECVGTPPPLRLIYIQDHYRIGELYKIQRNKLKNGLRRLHSSLDITDLSNYPDSGIFYIGGDDDEFNIHFKKYFDLEQIFPLIKREKL